MDVTSYLLGKNASGGGGDISKYFGELTASENSSISGIMHAIQEIPSDITVTGTSLQYAFSRTVGLKKLSLIDTSNITNMFAMCQGCENLEEIAQIDTSKVVTFSSAFNGCLKLATVPQLDTSSATNIMNIFNNCPSLSDKSLDNILLMCININPNYTDTKTLYRMGFRATNYPTSRIQALPHYQDFVGAGWTIGY